MFEYKDEKNKELTPELLASLSEGLFKREPFSHAKYHPTDDLATFMNRIKKVKAGSEGVEIEADNSKA